MEKKIGSNVSSGAEKVEAVENKTAKQSAKKQSVSKNAAQEAREQAQAAEREAAQARFEAAKARSAKKEASRMKAAQAKQKKMQQKLEAKQKRLEARAEIKSARAEKKAAKAARREMLATESVAEKKARIAREKRERLAKKQQQAQAREAALREKQEARKKAQEKRDASRSKKRGEKKSGGRARTPGIGGWIAAVSVLGAACLALAAVVTVGSFRMSDMTMRSANGYRATLYELVSVSEDLDDNFAKLRVSSGTGEQRTLLTQILVDTALMESAIEKIPVDAATGTDISSFVNRTGMCARMLLGKLSAGGALTEREQQLIAYLYETNAKLCTELNDLALHTPAEELAAYFEGKESGVGARLSEIGQGAVKKPEEIGDAPFAGEGNVGDNAIIGIAEVSASDAEEKVRSCFEGYHIADVRMTGETMARDFRAYNFVLTDENGTEYFAQVTKNGGKLAFFDSYEVCTQKNFTLENCDSLAQEYLARLGYTGLTPVWFSDAGNVASITYVADISGVRAYPDMIRVRVCEEKGRVVGMDAHAYLVNHHGKREVSPALTQSEARAKLASALEVQSGHLALIPLGRREVLTYEFVCKYGEEQFILYLDAHTGDEVRIFRVHESAQGSYLS